MAVKPLKRRAPLERRQSILAAARDILQVKDYHSIKMDEVAQAAGVAKGTLYLYFPTKDKLFQALTQEMYQMVLREWKSIWETTRPGEQRLKALIRSQLEFFERNRGLFLQVFQGNLPSLCMGGHKRHSQMIMANVHTTAQAVREAMDLKLFRRTDPLLAAVALFGLIRGFVFTRIMAGMPGRLTERAEFIWDVFYRGVAP